MKLKFIAKIESNIKNKNESQLLNKKKEFFFLKFDAHSRIRARLHLKLRMTANDHNWWTTMPVKRHQQPAAEKKDENEACASLLGTFILWICFWLLTLITWFNVGNNFTTTNASNILFEFLCSLKKISHGFNTKKKTWFL